MDKTDWDKSNKVVGFNVDFGPQNQSIFHSMNISQKSGTATAESLEIDNMLANQSTGKSTATQNYSLYSLYKNRSYTCDISMMGNAMLQPTMYFNLRHVPMFHGPYMITSVNHTIGPGVFDTIIEGIRQPRGSLSKITNYIEALKTNLLASIIEKNKQKSDEDAKLTNANSVGGTAQNQQSNAIAATNESKTIEPSSSCSDLLDSKYKKYTPVDTPTFGNLVTSEIITKILSRMANANIADDGKLKYVIFATIYLSRPIGENNLGGVVLSKSWGGSLDSYFQPKYFCMKNGDSTLLPYAVFNNYDDSIDMLISRYKLRMSSVKPDSDGKLSPSITKFWIENREPNISKNVYSQMDPTSLKSIEDKVKKSIDLFNSVSRKL
jgi:hypothetical protein